MVTFTRVKKENAKRQFLLLKVLKQKGRVTDNYQRPVITLINGDHEVILRDYVEVKCPFAVASKLLLLPPLTQRFVKERILNADITGGIKAVQQVSVYHSVVQFTTEKP